MKKDSQSKKIFGIVLCILGIIAILGVFAGGVALGRHMVKSADIKESDDIIEVNVSDDAIPTPDSGENETDATVPDNSDEDLGDFGNIVAEIDANTEEDITSYDDDKLQVVILGDSIYDMVRDETGIAYLISQQLDANVYNLAIGGTSATIGDGESSDDGNWTSTSGIGVAKVLAGRVSVDVLRDCTAKTIISENLDKFRNTDIFIVEYGINDFLSNKPLDLDYGYVNFFQFVNAMGGIVQMLRIAAPDAKIVLCEPTYCDFYGEGGAYIGSSNMVANWYGTLFDYKGKIDYVANSTGTYLFEAYLRSGIDSYTAEEYLLDGIHMTEAGRRRYADELCGYIKRVILGTEPPLEG